VDKPLLQKLDVLKSNYALKRFEMPKYPEDFTKEITLLQQVINVKRKGCGCYIYRPGS